MNFQGKHHRASNLSFHGYQHCKNAERDSSTSSPLREAEANPKRPADIVSPVWELVLLLLKLTGSHLWAKQSFSSGGLQNLFSGPMKKVRFRLSESIAKA